LDWYYNSDPLINGGQRMTTFFTYLHANCSMGETEFLNIKFNFSLHSHLCKFLICDEMTSYRGLRFRPIPGNSIFWFNMNEDGHVDNSTLHAGRPPGENGEKIGLNTWTRERIYSYN
jgi:prolyl 4-hydroxylase